MGRVDEQPARRTTRLRIGCSPALPGGPPTVGSATAVGLRPDRRLDGLRLSAACHGSGTCEWGEWSGRLVREVCPQIRPKNNGFSADSLASPRLVTRLPPERPTSSGRRQFRGWHCGPEGNRLRPSRRVAPEDTGVRICAQLYRWVPGEMLAESMALGPGEAARIVPLVGLSTACSRHKRTAPPHARSANRRVCAS